MHAIRSVSAICEYVHTVIITNNGIIIYKYGRTLQVTLINNNNEITSIISTRFFCTRFSFLLILETVLMAV